VSPYDERKEANGAVRNFVYLFSRGVSGDAGISVGVAPLLPDGAGVNPAPRAAPNEPLKRFLNRLTLLSEKLGPVLSNVQTIFEPDP
jgi:hypothetical protein